MKFDSDSFKSHLRLAMARCRLCHGKLMASSRSTRVAIADLLQADRLESAKIKTRLVIRDDYLAEALEQLESYLDDLIHSSTLLQLKIMDPSLRPALHAVLYACNRVDVPELSLVKNDILSKYGKIEDFDMLVDTRFSLKLSMRQPTEQLVDKYLEIIAESFGIKHKLPKGEAAVAVEQQQQEVATLEQHTPPPPPYCSDHFSPTLDDITQRFEQLKRKPTTSRHDQ